MKTQHTQGGWNRNIAPVSKYPIIFAGRNTHVAQVITRGIPEDEAEANARLIAAAPELLAELRKAHPHPLRQHDIGEMPNDCTICAAIAKAEGEGNAPCP